MSFVSDFLPQLLDYGSQLLAVWHDEFTEYFRLPEGTLNQFWVYLDLFPIMASLLWSLSALYGLLLGRKKPYEGELLQYTVVVPFFAESGGAIRTARSLESVQPPPKEIILVDDGSPLPCRLPPDMQPQVRVLRLPDNVGKAAAVQMAAEQIKTPILVCLDADVLVLSTDWSKMLSQFSTSPALGALTGAIRPGVCHRLIQFMQALDYLIVINFVKRAEVLWGALMTVSGAWVAYRVEAVNDCGGWKSDSSTEDIDLSWRLQGAGWHIGFAGEWRARVEMAPSWKSLWLQRNRWSAGLGRALRDHFSKIWHTGSTLLPVGIMAVATTSWLWGCLLRILLVIIGWISVLVTHGFKPHWTNEPGLIIRNWLFLSIYLGVFALQIVCAMISDGLRWRRYPILLLLVPLYPFYFWFLLFTGYFSGFVKGFLRRDSGRWRRTIRSVEIGS